MGRGQENKRKKVDGSRKEREERTREGEEGRKIG